MEEFRDERNLEETALPGQPLDLEEESETVLPDQYAAAYGEELSRTLDLDSWEPGDELAALYQRLEAEIQDAVRQEDAMRTHIRQNVFPLLWKRAGAPRNAGLHFVRLNEIEMVHRGFLFNGRVEACDGNSIPHDTLPLTIVQIGVCLVSYRGDQGSWVHRLYRRDLRISGNDPVNEALDLLERRRHRTGYDQESQRDRLTRLARRGIMAYAERAALLHRSEASWKMGHGNPAAFELLTGSGMMELAERGLDIIKELVLGHKKFVFVPSAPSNRVLLTIGNALYPMEYAIVDTLEDRLAEVAAGHYRGSLAWRRLGDRVQQFVREAGPKIVVGLYRASELAPAQMFYAHVDHAHEAALIALADSVLQEHRGFPMLVTLADTVCTTIFGTESLVPQVQAAYANARAPLRYQTERQTRR